MKMPCPDKYPLLRGLLFWTLGASTLSAATLKVGRDPNQISKLLTDPIRDPTPDLVEALEKATGIPRQVLFADHQTAPAILKGLGEELAKKLAQAHIAAE